MLTAYLAATNNLLQTPASPVPLYSQSLLTTFINTARGQLAGDAECIRFQATLPLNIGQQVYDFSSIDVSARPDIQGIINIRTIWIQVGAGQSWIRPRGFEWFSLYELNNVNPTPNQPKVWSQYAPGETGSFYVSPIPDVGYTATLDCVCLPIPLVDDTTPEAIPYLWTDAVPYFAAYYGLLSSQSATRQADADRMMQRYEKFRDNARRYTTPGVLPMQHPQNPDPFLANRLGVAPPSGGQ